MNKDNANVISNAMQMQSQEVIPNKVKILSELNKADNINAFSRVLGDKTPMFIQTVRNVLLSPNNKKLLECSANSILRSCMACAVTGLTIDPAFGQAAIVPFNSKSGLPQATFMPMKNGLVHLANNTGMFRKINAEPVYEGYIKEYNPITNTITWDFEKMFYLKLNPEERILIGYSSYIEMLNGYEHTMFWTVDEIKAHGRRYSKTFNRSDSLWNTNFPAMAEKTMIKQNLNKWGSLDSMPNSKLWLAMKFDQATPNSMDIESAVASYPDSVIDTNAEIMEDE